MQRFQRSMSRSADIGNSPAVGRLSHGRVFGHQGHRGGYRYLHNMHYAKYDTVRMDTEAPKRPGRPCTPPTLHDQDAATSHTYAPNPTHRERLDASRGHRDSAGPSGSPARRIDVHRHHRRFVVANARQDTGDHAAPFQQATDRTVAPHMASLRARPNQQDTANSDTSPRHRCPRTYKSHPARWQKDAKSRSRKQRRKQIWTSHA